MPGAKLNSTSNYKDAKEKLRALYKELLIQPKEIGADVPDDK